MSQERHGQQTQVQVWNSPEGVKTWEQETRQLQHAMEEATKEMLLAAELKSGDHVLDLAAGTGDQSLLAARKVGPAGMVLATDLSPEMLDVAAKRAQAEGLTTIMTRVMDAEQLNIEERSFDAVICRNGLMHLPHLQSALRGDTQGTQTRRQTRGLSLVTQSVPHAPTYHSGQICWEGIS